MIKIFLDFLFPKKCLLCKKTTKNYLCFTCFKLLKFKKIQCPKCSGPSQIGEFCENCRDKQILKGIIIGSELKDDNLNMLIKKYKYKFIKELSIPLSIFLINFLRDNIIKNPILNKQKNKLDLKEFIIIATPLSEKRLKWRGFNQSEEIVKIISKELKIKKSTDLKRVKHKKAQASLNKEERFKNIQNCFEWVGESLYGKKIIIFDDIFTSGASLNEMAKELKKHQAQEIWGLVLAHG